MDYSPWGHKESHTTEQLNNDDSNPQLSLHRSPTAPHTAASFESCDRRRCKYSIHAHFSQPVRQVLFLAQFTDESLHILSKVI